MKPDKPAIHEMTDWEAQAYLEYQRDRRKATSFEQWLLEVIRGWLEKQKVKAEK